ncbi:hypothetical protein [Metallibacterium sp.]|nr:hypothetical protein [Metallibacterium sp.]
MDADKRYLVIALLLLGFMAIYALCPCPEPSQRSWIFISINY